MRFHHALLKAIVAGASLAATAAPVWANTYSAPVWIARPANDARIRNHSGNLDVAIALAQPLNAATGDYVQLVVDGKVVADSSDSQHFKLLDLSLGTHTLEADLRNRHDQVLLHSTPVVVDMARPRG